MLLVASCSCDAGALLPTCVVVVRRVHLRCVLALTCHAALVVPVMVVALMTRGASLFLYHVHSIALVLGGRALLLSKLRSESMSRRK